MKKTILFAMWLFLSANTQGQSETCVEIDNNRRSTTTGKMCKATRLCFQHFTSEGATQYYNYKLLDSTGTVILNGEYSLPYTWQEGHPDTVRARIITHLELTQTP